MPVKRLLALTCGQIKGDAGFLDTGNRSRTFRYIPVPIFVIEHDDGIVVFDTGMSPQLMTDPVGHWGPAAAKIIIPVYQTGEDPWSRMRQEGIDPLKVDLVVNSHLHNDHAGCNPMFDTARFRVQRRELLHALQHGQREGYIHADIQADKINYETIEGPDDIFGDDTVVTIPLPGHTPGHQGLIVRLPRSGTVVVSADTVYTYRQLEEESPPGVVWDREQAIRSIKELKYVIRSEKAQLFVGHDPISWQNDDGSIAVTKVWQ